MITGITATIIIGMMMIPVLIQSMSMLATTSFTLPLSAATSAQGSTTISRGVQTMYNDPKIQQQWDKIANEAGKQAAIDAKKKEQENINKAIQKAIETAIKEAQNKNSSKVSAVQQFPNGTVAIDVCANKGAKGTCTVTIGYFKNKSIETNSTSTVKPNPIKQEPPKQPKPTPPKKK